MSARPKLGPEAHELIAARYLVGWSLRRIAGSYGVSPATVRSALARAGVEVRPPGRRVLRDFSPVTRARLVELLARREKRAVIALELGVSESTISRWVSAVAEDLAAIVLKVEVSRGQ